MTDIDAYPLRHARALAGEAEPRRADLVEVYTASYRPLVAFAYRLCGDVAAAEDIVHEAFVRLTSRWLGVRNPVPFLYRTVGNLATDAWRRRERDARAAAAAIAGRTEAAFDPAVADAVRRLPRAERTVVTLFYFADLPVTEVAALTGKAPGTVKWLLASARNRLAEQLGDPHA
ncbi:MAG TPA: sigma-70 family RNA polymerase sigma factor [Frankiaceae bacterium]|nr:sigma-70 family RNA polymerase sigma factor [Frankiaceae bacterium]